MELAATPQHATERHVRSDIEGALTIDISKISNDRVNDEVKEDACAECSSVWT